MNEDRSSFVDGHRHELIQRVPLVMPLADHLLEQSMLSNEAYAEIRVGRTPQKQMRVLYRSLHSGGAAVKTAFYHILRRENSHLVEELEVGPMEVDRDMSNTRDAEARVKDNEVLKAKWHKKSKKWQEKLHLLLEDPDLQSIGNGNLFMVKKGEYKIGDGADGTLVYLGMKADGTEVAIKQMIKHHSEELQNEMSLLRDLENIHIVKYVDLIEDGEFNYLVLQLCENNLEVYMMELRQKGEEERIKAFKKMAEDVLLGLEVLHKAGVIHRDIKPRNILIDVDGNARLADFGISRRLDRGASTRYTSRAGTKGWEATEILADENTDEGKCRYKRSTDIQVAGMLVHYILSDGHHPFGEGLHVLINILNGNYSLRIQDIEAKDLIEWMITKDPEKRPTISEVTGHPYLWNDDRRDTFFRKVGDENDIQNYRKPSEQLRNAVVKSSQGTSFTGWKEKVPNDSKGRPPYTKLPDDLLGLLRYLRNLLVHSDSIFEQNKNNIFKNLFPDFFLCAYKLDREMGWNN